MTNNIQEIIGQYGSNGWNDGIMWDAFDGRIFQDATSNGIEAECKIAYASAYEAGREERIKWVISENLNHPEIEAWEAYMRAGNKPLQAKKMAEADAKEAASISDAEFDALFGEIESTSNYTKRNPKPAMVGKVDISAMMISAPLGEIVEIDNGLTTTHAV